MPTKILTLLMLLAVAPTALLAQSQPASPQQSQPLVSLGFQAGLGYALTTGSLHDNFDGAVTFTGGLSGAWNRLTLKTDVDYSQPSFNRTNMFAHYDDEGRDAQINAAAHASLVGLNVQLGYTVVRTRRLSVTPAAGFRWSHYTWEVNDIEWSKNDEGHDVFKITDTSRATLSDVNWLASVAIDVRLHDRYLTDAPFMGSGQSRYTSSLRITPWVARAAFGHCTPAVSGCMVGVNLTYAGLLSRL